MARQKLEEARLEAEERARQARRPRHHNLDLATLGGDELDEKDIPELQDLFKTICVTSHPKRVADVDDTTYDDDKGKGTAEMKKLKSQMESLKVVARAKVTNDRIYSAAYHPDRSKDLIFFGGENHCIW